MKKIVLLTWLLLAALVCCGCDLRPLLALLRTRPAAVEDYSDRAGEYRRTVAGMAAPSPGTGEVLTIVLIQTDGRDPEAPLVRPDRIVKGARDRFTASFSDRSSAEAYVAWLNAQPWVVYAEIDEGVNASAVAAADVSYTSWGAAEMGFAWLDTYVEAAGEGTRLVAVIDSGTYCHSLIADRIFAWGYDYVDLDDDPSNDGLGHGTAVAGIVADCTQGMPVYLLPIRVLNDSGGGRISNVVNAIDEAVETGADVVNLSLTSSKCHESLHEAIRAANAAGVTVVCAAGNSGRDIADVCPGHMPDAGLIVVGAVEANGTAASYSNYGDTVDLCAYGSSIRCCAANGGYTYSTGTSMAAPHVAAACAALGLLPSAPAPEALVDVLTAVCVSGAPHVSLLVPQGFAGSATALALPVGTRLRLDDAVLPGTHLGVLTWTLSGDGPAHMEGDVLVCDEVGTLRLRADVDGLELYELFLTVIEEAWSRLPAALSALGDEVFLGADSLRLLRLPDGLTEIGPGAFAGAVELQTVAVPASVASIGEGAFLDLTAVLLCTPNGAAMRYAQAHGLEFLCGTVEE